MYGRRRGRMFSSGDACCEKLIPLHEQEAREYVLERRCMLREAIMLSATYIAFLDEKVA